MKVKFFLFLFLLIICYSAITNGGILESRMDDIKKIYSQNRVYYMVVVPFDSEAPTLRGMTTVFKTGDDTPLYTLERGFDLFPENFIDRFSGKKISRYIYLSNDGQTILYICPERMYTEKTEEGLNSINIYKNGKLFKSYTDKELIGCATVGNIFEMNDGECETLVYSEVDKNIERAYDLEKSKLEKRKVYKRGINDKKKFLMEFSVFCYDDIVYLTDPKKRVHLFDLSKGVLIRTERFNRIYNDIKNKASLNEYESVGYNMPYPILEFPNLEDGRDTYKILADLIGMEQLNDYECNVGKKGYRTYQVWIDAYLTREGLLEINNISVDDQLSKDKINNFFNKNRFDSSFIPEVFDKWYLGNRLFCLGKMSEKTE